MYPLKNQNTIICSYTYMVCTLVKHFMKVESNFYFHTLDFFYDLNKCSPTPKNFNIIILFNFCINQGIAVIFQKKNLQIFPKINKHTLTFIQINKRILSFFPDSWVRFFFDKCFNNLFVYFSGKTISIHNLTN